MTRRKKRIFGPRRTGSPVRVVSSIALLLLVAASSFGAGVYVGARDQAPAIVASAVAAPADAVVSDLPTSKSH